jgi:hypothetical protein
MDKTAGLGALDKKEVPYFCWESNFGSANIQIVGQP